MSSIITALTNLSCKLTNDITEVISSRILANVMGDSLHSYIESLFIDNILSLTPEEINIRKQEIFSWAGNQNNIPDLILKGSDAIEIKKIEATGSLALNSSYPKQTLSNTSSMITDACKNCEGDNLAWTKELWYALGTVIRHKVKYLFFIQGKLYAADESIYSRIKKNIKCGVEEIENIRFSETKELGRVNKVDPLGITSLRIRGMWTIEHPFQVFDYIPELQKHNNVNKLYVYALMDDIKYSTFCEEEKNILISQDNVNIYDKQVKNPNNPVQLINAKLITIEI